MSEFINTIDELGDEIFLSKLIEGSLNEFKDNTVTTLRRKLFSRYSSSIDVDLPNVTEIGVGCFEYCHGITSIKLPKLTTADSSTFIGCNNLISIYAPNLTNIGMSAFQHCGKLKIADISPSGLPYACFANCTSLDTLILRSGAVYKHTGSNVFDNTPIKSGTGYIYVPRALIDSYKAHSDWKAYANQFRILEDYTIDGTTTGEFQMPSVTRKFASGSATELYSEATNIREYAAYERTNLTTVDLPNATSIGNYAFMYCDKLISVDLPKVTSAGSSVFNGCQSLISVNLPLVTSVDVSMFRSCTSLTTINLQSVTSIGYYAFGDNIALQMIDLPNVTTINGGNEFYGCSNLITVILRSNTICSLSKTDSFKNTPIASGTGYIYVPSTLIDEYKSATNWSVHASQFRAIEDYPEITGGGN